MSYSRLLGFVSVAKAAAIPSLTPDESGLHTGSGDTTGLLTGVGDRVLSILLILAGAAAVLYLIWAGIQYLMSGGDAAKVKTARSAVISAVIGVALVLSVYAIVRLATSIGNTVDRAVPGTAAPAS